MRDTPEGIQLTLMTQKGNFQNKDKLFVSSLALRVYLHSVTLFTNASLKRLWNTNDQTARNLLKF